MIDEIGKLRSIKERMEYGRNLTADIYCMQLERSNDALYPALVNGKDVYFGKPLQTFKNDPKNNSRIFVILPRSPFSMKLAPGYIYLVICD